MNRLFLISIVLFFLAILIFPIAFAQEASPELVNSPSPSPVEYVLPYPGILPDHPLYFLKLFRDWILLIFITNPVKKVEFHILLADKRLNMGVFLHEKGKDDLAYQTVSQGVEYLVKAEELFFQIPPGENDDKTGVKDKLEKSILKQLEVLDDLQVGDQEKTDRYDKLIIEIQMLNEDFSRKK